MLPKRPRVVDSQAVEAVRARDVYCLVCGRQAMKYPHHIVTRGAWGSDTPENMVMLCLIHHRAAHDGGLSKEELQDLLRRKYGYDDFPA